MTPATRALEPFGGSTLAEARAAATRTADTKRRAAGAVLALADRFRDALPAALRRAVQLYADASDAHESATALASSLSTELVSRAPAVLADVLERSAVNAMVAHYVLGLRVILRDDRPEFANTWRVEAPGGKRKPVPDFASDPGAIAVAERALPEWAFDAYGKALAHEVADVAMPYTVRLALASPLARARALLAALDVDPDNPPAWIRDRTAPGT